MHYEKMADDVRPIHKLNRVADSERRMEKKDLGMEYWVFKLRVWDSELFGAKWGVGEGWEGGISGVGKGRDFGEENFFDVMKWIYGFR